MRQVAMILVTLVLAGCGGGAEADNPRLPDGLDTLLVAPMNANAWVYLHPRESINIFEDAFAGGPPGDSGDRARHKITALEAVAMELDVDHAVRVTFERDSSAERIADSLTMNARDSAAGDWVIVRGGELALGSTGDWGDDVRKAWETEERVSLPEQYSDFWDLLQLMPDNPPARPVAAGFALHVADLIDQMLQAKGTAMPGLTDGFGLLRVGLVAFVGYSDELGDLPGGSTGAILRELDVGAVFVVRSGYPGFVVDLAFNRLSSGSGLVKIDVADDTANYREVNPDFQLMIKTFGTTVFFAVGPTRERTEALMASVIRTQATR
jgi:hypothetical protein